MLPVEMSKYKFIILKIVAICKSLWERTGVTVYEKAHNNECSIRLAGRKYITLPLSACWQR